MARVPLVSPTVLDCESRLRLALDLFASGCGLVRERLQRQHPGATRETIEDLLQQWCDIALPRKTSSSAVAWHGRETLTTTVTALDELLVRAVADLRALGHDAALVGGLAVSARTEPRFTRDIDLAVAVADDRRAEARGRDLQALLGQWRREFSG